MKMKLALSGLCLTIATTSFFIFANGKDVRGEERKAISEINNTKLCISGNDAHLLKDYNETLAQKQYQQMTDQKFFDEVNRIGIQKREQEIIANEKAEKNRIKKLKSKKNKIKQKGKTYTEDDLYLISHIIQGEAGSDFIDDVHQQLVGMVVINRTKSKSFPNTIKEVVYQKGQYQSVSNGTFNQTPSKRAVENAKLVLEGKVDCPNNVIYQAEFKQGSGIYKTIKTIISTTYFCYE